MTDTPALVPEIGEFSVRICRDCYDLKGEMCHNPECVFCRRTMAEVGEALDMLLIRPLVDGERIDAQSFAHCDGNHSLGVASQPEPDNDVGIAEERRQFNARIRELEADLAAAIRARTVLEQENERLRDWQACVTVALRREGGAFFDEVPSHIRDLVSRAEAAEQAIAQLRAALVEIRHVADREVALTDRNMLGGQSVGNSPRMQRSLALELQRLTSLVLADRRLTDRESAMTDTPALVHTRQL